MASLRTKLQRLDASQRGKGAHASRNHLQQGGASGLQLERVRAQLGVVLGGVVANGDDNRDVSLEDHELLDDPGPKLPFLCEPTVMGDRHVLGRHYALDERIGHVELLGAVHADARLLSLLSLTPSLAGCDPQRALFLDTETSGLGGGTGNVAFLVGMAWFDEQHDQYVFEQLFLRDIADELPLLERVRDRIASAGMLVSYNGKSFDMPILRARFVMSRMQAPEEPPHLDLLHVARRVHPHRSWRKNLGMVEREVLGFYRSDDEVSGQQVAQHYAHYLRTGDEGLLHGVVDHNRRDVMSLVALMGIYGESLEATGRQSLSLAARPQLEASEIAAMARVVRRAGDLELAHTMVELALRLEACPEALRASGEIAKARGDKARAIADFEAYALLVNNPQVRLELAKLYEHFARSPERALQMVDLGTTEHSDRSEHRRHRLLRKLDRAAAD